MSDTLKRLQAWYQSNCDGDWEHYENLTLSTTDNPGWSLVVNTSNCDVPLNDQDYMLIEQSDDIWLGYKVESSTFLGASGAGQLQELIEVFLKMAEEAK